MCSVTAGSGGSFLLYWAPGLPGSRARTGEQCTVLTVGGMLSAHPLHGSYKSGLSGSARGPRDTSMVCVHSREARLRTFQNTRKWAQLERRPSRTSTRDSKAFSCWPFLQVQTAATNRKIRISMKMPLVFLSGSGKGTKLK